MQLDLTDITRQIIQEKTRLRDLVNKIEEYSTRKAITSSEYDKKRALVLVGLRNGKEFFLEGQKVYDPPVSIMSDIAKGICWQESLERDKADGLYKGLMSAIEETKTQINALQSINKYQSEI